MPVASWPRSCDGPIAGRSTDADLRKPMELYRQARAEGGFDAGIEMALGAVLVNPQFLFRIEPDPPGVAPHSAYRIPDVQLASRLSFFLWSSIPDDELLDLAERGELSKPEVLERQVRRMLADPRSRSLVTNFAGQWLHLRNLESITPDLRLFPDFDDNLRQAFRRETELLFEERPARGPERARPAEVGPHLPERAPGPALRHPARLRQPVPPRAGRGRQQCGAACSARGAS